VAAKPTIYKLRIDLSDLDQDHYDSLNLTLAQHPSETIERMMVRVLAYCFNAKEDLGFGKGLSDTDEADLCSQTLHGSLALWIDVGEPGVERIKKATRRANLTKVYSFNSKSTIWWERESSQFALLPVAIFRFQWLEVQALAKLIDRTADLSISIAGDSAYVATAQGECELTLHCLQTVTSAE